MCRKGLSVVFPELRKATAFRMLMSTEPFGNATEFTIWIGEDASESGPDRFDVRFDISIYDYLVEEFTLSPGGNFTLFIEIDKVEHE
jgi:hypothetical protein